MRSVPWDRPATISRVRRDIWRYLSQASRTDDQVVLDAAALLQMPAADVRILSQLQFVLSEEVERLLESMPFLIRRLTTTSVAELETSSERVRGAIRWGETFGARAATGLPHVFVTAPARRAFNTPENELLAFALSAVADFGKSTGWHRSTARDVGITIQTRVSEAVRWLAGRALSEVPVREPSPRTISRVRSGRSRRIYRGVLDVIRLYQQYVARLDRNAIRRAVEQHAVITSRDPVLLELLCAFGLVDALRDDGWLGHETGLLRPPLIFSATRGDSRLDLYYQHVPSGLTRRSIYRDIQQAHAFRGIGGLIPDLVLRVASGEAVRWVMVEVKGVERSVADSARRAALDLLAYRRAFASALKHQGGPYGIGIAWGERLVPSTASEVVLCTPDTIGSALASIFGSRPGQATPPPASD